MLKNLFAKDTVKTAAGRVANLEARLRLAEQQHDAAKDRLGCAASNAPHDNDADLLQARAAMRQAADLREELTAGLEISHRALRQAEEHAAAARLAKLTTQARKARAEQLAAAQGVDTALAQLGAAYTELTAATTKYDAAARAANPAAGRMGVHSLRFGLLGALWNHAPAVAKLIQLPYRADGATGGRRRPFLQSLSSGGLTDVLSAEPDSEPEAAIATA